MKQTLVPCLDLSYRALIWTASLAVPQNARAEWRQEWVAELWHARQSYTSEDCSWSSERRVLAFVRGSIPDALSLFSPKLPPITARPLHASAWTVLLCLGIILIGSFSQALLSRNVVAERRSERYKLNPKLVFIQDAHTVGSLAATIPVQRYRTWKSMRQRYFDDLAFYRIEDSSIPTYLGSSTRIRVAVASTNLFSLLGLHYRQSDSFLPSAKSPLLVLSHDAWERGFKRDPGLIGKSIRIGNVEAQVVGIAEDGIWRLPGNPAAWLLLPDRLFRSSAPGYVVAHMTSSGWSQLWNGRVPILDRNEDDSDNQLWGIAIEDRSLGPWPVFITALILAFVALPAVTSVVIADYDYSRQHPNGRQNLMRHAYLAAKVLMILLIAYFGSLDLAYSETIQFSPAAATVQFLSTFFLCLFGTSWAILDQRRRCPVCLRCVTHPARVGIASRTFLAWNGTELMCEAGHSLLHVPALPTSWFHEPRWVYLDPSWSFLFAP